jgi:hypothetical protein
MVVDLKWGEGCFMCLYRFYACIPCLASKKMKKKKMKKIVKKCKQEFVYLCIADSNINQLICRIVVSIPTLRSLYFRDPYISISPFNFGQYLYNGGIVHLKWRDGR